MLACGEQHRCPLVVAHPRCIAAAAVREMRCEQHIESEIRQLALKRHESDALQDHVTPRICQDFFLDPVPAVSRGVVNAIRGNAGRHLDGVGVRISLFFGEVDLAVGDNETEIAGARVIDARVVDLVEDPMGSA
jgi:hypothetical protein